jgi:thiosulfate dehydrogenase [quinone] large subunit
MAQTIQAEGFQEPKFAQFIFASPKMAIFWLLVRVYVGWEWFTAGIGKLNGEEAGWSGAAAGQSITAFVGRALPQVSGAHPNVYGWYADFLQAFVLPHAAMWSYVIGVGETLVGLGLIVGLFTGIAAFFGGLMNASYLLAGTVSINPGLFILATWLVLAWRAAGLIGLDRFVLPMVGVPGQPGSVFKHQPTAPKLSPAH